MCIVMDKLDGGDLVEGLQRHLKAGNSEGSGRDVGGRLPNQIVVSI